MLEPLFVLLGLGAVVLMICGAWSLIQVIARSLSSAPPELRPGGGDELLDLKATERQLKRLVARGLLSEQAGRSLQAALDARRWQILGMSPPPAPETTPFGAAPPVAPAVTPRPAPVESQPGIAAQAPEPTIVEAVLAPEPPRPEVVPAAVRPLVQAMPRAAGPPPREEIAAAAEQPVARPAAAPVSPPKPAPPKPLAPPKPPRPPRQSWAKILSAFMEDKNIRWGELVGGLLIVGCSIALVVSLRDQLQAIPYFRFLVFGGVTASLFGVGLYTAHRWKLESTSGALLVIATLLVPLNFLAMAWLSGKMEWLYTFGTGGVALVFFAWLCYLSARVIVPEGRVVTTSGVIVNSALLLGLSKFVDSQTPLAAAFALGCLPVACHTLSLGHYLWSLARRPVWTERQAKEWFVLLGVVTFATAAALGVLAFRAGRVPAVLEPLAPLVCIVALPLVAGGLLVSRRLGEGAAAAGLRTAGTGVAFGGLTLMVAAVALAWRDPGMLILVTLINFVGMSFFAFRGRLPLIHALALACLALSYLTAFHWLCWLLRKAGEDFVLRDALLSVQSGTAAVGLVVVLAAASEWLGRRYREHAAWYAGAAGVLAVLSILLVTWDALLHRVTEVVARTAIVYAVYSLAILAVNLRWRRSDVTYFGLALGTGSVLWTLQWLTFGFSPLWGTALAAETLAMATCGWWLCREHRAQGGAAGHERRVSVEISTGYGDPLLRSSEVLCWLTLGAAVWAGWRLRDEMPWTLWNVATGVGLTAASVGLLAGRRRADLAQLAGGLLAASMACLGGWAAQFADKSDLVLVMAFALSLASALLAGVATWVAWLVATQPAAAAAGGPRQAEPWYLPLARQWLHTSMGAVVIGVALACFSKSLELSSLPHFGAWLAAAACILAAWGYRQAALSWVGSAFVLAGIAHALVWRYPESVAHPWSTALLLHATFVMLGAALASRFARASNQAVEVAFPSRTKPTSPLSQTVLMPFVDSGFVSSAAALVMSVSAIRTLADTLPSAIDLFWVTGIYLVAGWLQNRRVIFAVGQGALTLGVLLATASWLAARSWVGDDVQRLLDPWSLQAFAVALGLISVAWAILRVVLRDHEPARRLFGDDRLAVDRLVFLTTVFSQFVVAAWCLLPGVYAELPFGSPDLGPPFVSGTAQAHACGLGAWVVLGVLISALVVALWSRWRDGELLAAVALGATPALLAAGQFGPSVATASALRWSLGASFLVLSAAIWLRRPLRRAAEGWHARLAPSRESVAQTSTLTICLTALPAVALTLLAVVLQRLNGPAAGPSATWLAWFSPEVSYLAPMALVVAGLVGYAVREHSGEYAFAGGLLAAFSVVGGYLLAARSIDVVLAWQLFLIACSVWGLLWLFARQRLQVWCETTDKPRNQSLMTLQLAIPAVGNGVLLLIAFVALGVFFADELPNRAGTAFGWAVLLLAVAAWVVRARQTARRLRPQTIGLVGLATMGLLACTMVHTMAHFGATPRDQARWGYITLEMGWAMYALAVVAAIWWTAVQRYPRTEPPPVLVRMAATWVRVPAVLAVILGLKGAWLHDLTFWSAGAIGVASAAGAAMAVWRRREGWAFVSGLGVNLAASLVVVELNVPTTHPWLFLLQANLIAAAIVAILWLAVRRRLYPGRDLSLTAGPLLAVQVGALLAAHGLLFFIGASSIFLDPAGTDIRLNDVVQPAGWYAWALTLAAISWYAWQVMRRRVAHLPGLALVSLGIMVAGSVSMGWPACHALMATWGIGGVLLLALGIAGELGVLPPAGQGRVGQVLAELPWSEWWRVVSRWAVALAWLLFAFSARAGWTDPDGPLWATGSVLLASLLLGLAAIQRQSLENSYASGMILCVAASLLWWHWLPHTPLAFLYANATALSAGAILWAVSAWGSQRVAALLRTRHDLIGYPQFAALAALAAVAVGAGLAVLDDLRLVATTEPATTVTTVMWLGSGATAAAFLLCLRLPPRVLARAGLYGLGLAALATLVHHWGLDRDRALWSYGWLLSGYAFLAAVIDISIGRQARLAQWLDVATAPVASRHDWFSVAQAVVGTIAAPLTVWTVFHFFDSPPHRIAGPLSILVLLAVAILRSERTAGAVRRTWQSAVPLLAALVLAELGWASWPSAASRWLEGSVVLMASLLVTAAACGWLGVKGLRAASSWSEVCRRAIGVLGAGGVSVLVLVLLQEAMLGPELRPVSLGAVLLVAATLFIFFLACLILAVSARPDPFGLSDRGRQAYVYAAELLIVVLAVHIWFTEPQWFQLGIFRKYWLFWIMGFAFGGAGLAQWFERCQLPVLAEPLARTALALPLLPAAGVWLELRTESSPLVWLLLAAFYALEAYRRRAPWCVVASFCSANFGLWFTWYQWDVSFFTNPQLWLIPPALAVLVAEHLNHDRLREEQAASIRYLALAVVYISSTADMFIAGVGESLLLPLVLAFLSVAGVLAGIVLRSRAFLLLGIAFLMVVLMTMIWYAAVDLHNTWVWYVSGIVLGIGIIALFALFEKRRNDVLAAVERFKSWR